MGIPNIEEVRTEASKIGLPPEQADAFRDYHQSAGWRVGRNPMRDWRSALRTWKRRAQDRKHAPNGNAMKLLPGQQLKLWQDRVEAIRSKLTTLPAGGERSALIAEKKQIEAQIQELSKA